MPFIKIYGLHRVAPFPSDFYGAIRGALCSHVRSIEELEIRHVSDTSVVFIQEENPQSVINTVEVVITLFAKPKRTLDVRNRLAKVVGESLAGVLHFKCKIFCHVNHVDRDAVGAWKSE